MNCIKCGKQIESEKAITIFGNNVVCEDCYNHREDMIHCSLCGQLVFCYWTSEIYDGNCDDYIDVCPTCCKKRTGKYSHGYKPYPKFHSCGNGDRKHCLHVGVELELESQFFNEAEHFMDNVDYEISEDDFYMKEDGSLDDDCGVEVISHPMMLPVALEKWEKMFRIINKNNMTSTSNCGLHIHLDKEYLNERQMQNIDYIINTFVKTVEKLGGRNIEKNDWSEILHKRMEDWGKKTTDNRYVAVNFCKNTIELRCFNSTDDWFNFRWILISVFALVEYAKIHNLDFFRKKTDSEFEIAFHKFVNNFITK